MSDDPRRLSPRALNQISVQVIPGPINYVCNWSDAVVRKLLNHIQLIEEEIEAAKPHCPSCGHGLDGCEDDCACRCCNADEVCEDYDLCKCPICARGWDELAAEGRGEAYAY